MPQRKILVDSCSYIRLAETINPLLGVEFGDDCICLYVIKDFQKEYDNKPELKTKYPSLNDLTYQENRKNQILLSNKKKKQIPSLIESFDDFAIDNNLMPSYVDLHALATAYLAEVELVTDDSDLIEVAEEFEVPVKRTLELLKLMLDSNHIDFEQVEAVIEYLEFLPDKPKHFARDKKNLFPELDN